jgi:glycosyltransferase involved in cell wall biosynthesis
MPKVLRIFNRFILGGPVLNALILSKYLSPDFETKLISGVKDEGEKTAEGLLHEYGITPVYIPQMRRSVNPFQDIIAYDAIRKLIKEYKPDIVHTHAAKAGALGRFAAASCNVPVIIHTFHGHVFHSYFNKPVTQLVVQTERYLAKRSTKIIAISQSQKNELVNQFKICSEDKVAVIPNGIDLEKFSTNQLAKRLAWRNKFNIPSDTILIGIVGRMAPVKNHALFVQAIHSVLKKTDDKNLKFAIIGDGETRMETQALLESLSISYNYFPENPATEISRVLLTSWQTEMDYVYAGLDIVCLTSLNEGTPISLIEAQAAKKPIVSTNVGAVTDTVIVDKSALLSPSNNSSVFAEKLLSIISNKDLREQMGNSGYKFVNEKYSHQRLVKDMSQLYNHLLDNIG